MDQVTLRQQVRPKTFAFVVDCSDQSSFLRAVAANSGLWGGIYNPLLPLADPGASPVQSFILGYFEPDCVVVSDGQSLALPLGFQGQVVPWSDVWNSESVYPRQGVGAVHLLQKAYKESLRFVLKQAPRAVSCKGTASAGQAFLASVFGHYQLDSLESLEEAFREVFEPKVVDVSDEELSELVVLGTSPIHMTTGEVKRSAPGHSVRAAVPHLLVLDMESIADLVAYWNIRAAGVNVFPVPIQLHDAMLPGLWAALADHVVAWGRMKVLGTPRVDAQVVAEAVDVLLDKKPVYVELVQFPDEEALYTGNNSPLGSKAEALVSAERLVEVPIQRSRRSRNSADALIRLSLYRAPLFDDGDPWLGETYVNAVSLDMEKRDERVARVLPEGPIQWSHLLDSVGPVWRYQNSLAYEVPDWGEDATWRLPTTLDVFHAWLRTQGMELRLSDKGRILQRLLASAGGVHGIGFLANKQLIDCLDKMADGELVEEESDDASETPAARGKHITPQGMRGLLLGIHSGSGFEAGEHLEWLLEHRVLKLGLKLRCPHCKQKNWFAVSMLDEKLACDWCLEEWNFPDTEAPKEEFWKYRAIGPFSIREYIAGCYPVALTLRFLAERLGTIQDRIPSFEVLNLGEADSWAEADFGLMLRSRAVLEPQEPRLIIGECKSSRCFEEKDVRRLAKLGQRIAGTTLVFSKMNGGLSGPEKARLGELARAWREDLAAQRPGNPLIVLTEQELFSGGCGTARVSVKVPPGLSPVVERRVAHDSVMTLALWSQHKYLSI